ncbi:hypothetical protein ACFLY6_02120 [Candidatus Dependentiae bacterium]
MFKKSVLTMLAVAAMGLSGLNAECPCQREKLEKENSWYKVQEKLQQWGTQWNCNYPFPKNNGDYSMQENIEWNMGEKDPVDVKADDGSMYRFGKEDFCDTCWKQITSKIAEYNTMKLVTRERGEKFVGVPCYESPSKKNRRTKIWHAKNRKNDLDVSFVDLGDGKVIPASESEMFAEEYDNLIEFLKKEDPDFIDRQFVLRMIAGE